MRNPITLILLSVTLALAGCTTAAQSQFYRPAGSYAEPYRIGGKFEAAKGWAGQVTITINDQTVIQKKLPAFTNTTEVQGRFEGKSVTVVITRVHTFVSSYVRADVMIGNERAASLTF